MAKPKRVAGIRPRQFDAMHQWPLLGIDEVGTGCAAGPVAAAGVVLPNDHGVLDALEALGLRDSKQMTEAGRRKVRDLVVTHAPYCSVQFVHPRMLEDLGQGRALDRMFNLIMGGFRSHYGTAGSIVLDGDFRKNLEFFHVAVHQGDQKSFSVAAASVVAKVARDELMHMYAADFPGYDLESNKGYLTPAHLASLKALGVSEIHRRNVKPVADLIAAGKVRSGQSLEGASETELPPAEMSAVAQSRAMRRLGRSRG